MRTGAEGSGVNAYIFGAESSLLQVIRGTIPTGTQEFSLRGAIHDPAALCAHLLADAL